jgi:outer membrane protein TolC
MSEQGSDVDRAEAKLAQAREELAELEAEMQAEVRALQAAAPAPAIESVAVAPRKGDLSITRFAFAWVAVAP